MAVVDAFGVADTSAAIDLVTRLRDSGYKAATIDIDGARLKALQRGRQEKLRLADGIGHVLLAELGEITLVENPGTGGMKSARLDLSVKILTIGGLSVAAFDAAQVGPGFPRNQRSPWPGVARSRRASPRAAALRLVAPAWTHTGLPARLTWTRSTIREGNQR